MIIGTNIINSSQASKASDSSEDQNEYDDEFNNIERFSRLNP